MDLLANVDRSDERSPLYVSLHDRISSADHTIAGIEYTLAEARCPHVVNVDDDGSGKPLLSQILDGINRLNSYDPPATRGDLLTKLDQCLPGGLEGLLELSLRLPDETLHQFLRRLDTESLNTSEEKSELAACLLGISAALVGDLQLDDSHRETLITPKAPGHLLDNYLRKAAALRERLSRENPSLRDKHFVPLRKYLSNRLVVIIEDQFRYGWDKLLPRLLGTPSQGGAPTLSSPNLGPVQCAGLSWRLFDNLGQFLDADRSQNGALIEECDLVLLDLFSSRHPDRAEGLVSPTLKKQLADLQFRLASARKRCDPEAGDEDRNNLPHCRIPPPVILAFTTATTGITTRTMRQEILVDDIFFKQPQGTAHRRLHYYTFRQSIISALERRAAWISYSTEFHFQRWFQQFDAVQRPVVLKAMETYRHYSAASMVRLASSRMDGKWLKELKNTEATANKNRWISYLGRVNKSGPAAVGIIAKALDVLVRKEHGGTSMRLNEKIRAYTFEALIDELRIWLKEPEARKRGNITLVLVDDFVGSGGQIANNIREFLSEELFVSADLTGLHVELWFALGLDTPSLRKFLKCGTDSLESGRDYTIDVEILPKKSDAGWLKLKRPKPNEKKKSNSHKHLSGLKMTLRIEEVIPQINFNDAELGAVLKSRPFIAGGREFELPCQFEPFGWKSEVGGGGLVSTFANVPGNTLPIIWASGDREEWIPLRHRFFNPFDAGRMEVRPPCLASGQGGVCPLDVNTILNGTTSRVPQAETLDLRHRNDLKGKKYLEDREFDMFRREVYAGLACKCAKIPRSVRQKGQSR
ncbi:MAG TPA: hypothetical protein PLX89_04790 [Verrucomicrobiota bacterium]|nr:hypothetical protein [Verrucomicrobiota bacterium]